MTNLNKFIASCGLSSRRGADKIIAEGRVTINGRIAKPVDKVGPNDRVCIDQKPIESTEKLIYLAFNKPVGVICTTDKNSPNNIMDYIKTPERVFPIGRLDVNTEGLILLSNDGELANIILKNKTVEKEYIVTVDNSITDHFLHKMANGTLRIDGYPVLKAVVRPIDERSFSITITEGRKRQIRRMCDSLKYNVTKLKRVRIGKIKVDDITSGKYIIMDPENIYNLLEIAK